MAQFLARSSDQDDAPISLQGYWKELRASERYCPIGKIASHSIEPQLEREFAGLRRESENISRDVIMKLSPLPLPDFSRIDVKQWMRFRNDGSTKLLTENWCALLQLFFQVNPFEEKLSFGLFN